MKRKIIIPLILIIVISLGLIVWKRHNRLEREERNQKQAELEQRIADEIKLPAINGLEVAERIAKRRPVAVMIENHPDSRPQSALSQADIVYETLTEGGITRFLALFQSRDPEEIGPVRSTRPYFNLLANQWSPVLAHSGGSQSALQELSIGYYRGIADADEMLNGTYYRRATDKFAPHNLYTSTEKMHKLIEDRNISEWKPVTHFTFKRIPTSELKLDTTEITIPFSTASYLVKFSFDESTNTYKRFIGGKSAIDKNSQASIDPKNIIVQFTESAPLPNDPTGALQFKLDRSGRIYLFTGGSLVTGTWKFKGGSIEYKDSAGNPLVIQPGQTWIAIVPFAIQNNVTWK